MMDSVKEIFEAAAAKYLTAVDAAPSKPLTNMRSADW